MAATVVIKLGSSIVADQSGEVREDVLREVVAQTAELRAAGREVVLVTSGAIARGMRLMELGVRPRAVDELQAASAVGQGKLYRVFDELLAGRGLKSAQVLLTFFDISARSHYLNARQTLRKLLDCRSSVGDGCIRALVLTALLDNGGHIATDYDDKTIRVAEYYLDDTRKAAFTEIDDKRIHKHVARRQTFVDDFSGRNKHWEVRGP